MHPVMQCFAARCPVAVSVPSPLACKCPKNLIFLMKNTGGGQALSLIQQDSLFGFPSVLSPLTSHPTCLSPFSLLLLFFFFYLNLTQHSLIRSRRLLEGHAFLYFVFLFLSGELSAFEETFFYLFCICLDIQLSHFEHLHNYFFPEK